MERARELWPAPSPEAQANIRSVATYLLPRVDEFLDDLVAAQQTTTSDPIYDEGNALLEAVDRQITRRNVQQWLAHNIDEPGMRVPAAEIEELATYARDLALRGVDANDTESWRASQRVLWRRWLDACFAVPVGPDCLREVLDISASSLATFVDDSITKLGEHVNSTVAELADPPYLQRQATVQAMIKGAPVDRRDAETKLRYPLAGSHVAAVVWADAVETTASLELKIDELIRVAGSPHHLTLVAGISTVWLWLRADDAPTPEDLASVIGDTPGIHISVGRNGHDVAGFRRSHIEAIAAKRLLDRLGSSHSVARYQDLQALALITQDMNEAEVFVADTLGDLASADDELRLTVRTFIHQQFNTSHTAEKLFAHRNTIDRRLTKAYDLLPRPLTENASAVDIALLLVELRGGPTP